MENLIEIKNVTFGYETNNVVLNNVSLDTITVNKSVISKVVTNSTIIHYTISDKVEDLSFLGGEE